MLVYQIYNTFETTQEAMNFCKLPKRPWQHFYVFLGFYKEQGGYAECILSDKYGPREFRYTSAKDVLKKVRVRRNIDCMEERVDLLYWQVVETGKVWRSLCKYEGFAKPIGRNIYMIPA